MITFQQIYGGIWKQYEDLDFFKKVKEYTEEKWTEFNTQGFLSGRIKIGGFDFSGFQNFGFEYKDLKGVSYRDLPAEELKSKYLAQFEQYKTSLFEFENIS